MEQLIIEASSIECSEERREISGKIVPMGTGEVGQTNMGGVVFEAGSIDIADPTKIKLLSQHDMKKPVGRMMSATVRPDGIYATFKLSRSTGGNDALVMAQEGLVSGLSVGAEIIASKPSRDGHIVVSLAKLKEVSLVTEPAFKTAQVLEIAAEEASTVEIQPTESETVVENTPETVAAPEVEASAVEAARPTVVANLQVRERTAPITSAQYLEANIKAALGDDEARRTVRAADDSSSTNTGLTLPQHLNTFITDTFTGRPAFNAATRGALVDSGLSFTVPRMYTNASTSPNTAPTVADTDEGVAPSETGMTSAYDTVTINKFSGLQRVSFELIDRSSPAFMELVMAELRKAYEKATDAALISALTTSGKQDDGRALSAAALQSFISVNAAKIYGNTGGDYASALVASPSQWGQIMSYADTTGRALYTAASPMNQSGATRPTSVVGDVLGTNLIVDHNITTGTGDNSMFLVAPSSVYTWESPTTQLRVNVLTSGEVEINLYGYLAIYVAKDGGGVYRYNFQA
ncbi:major_cap_HK97, phage major capsid protein, HK97 family [uncultured Caudovirales phage]|uniref:Major_cap_HK97, phage major capsid protein, HK97 family n=1 Tax=uncultured Caudovirales phage TaxID=2100421 RepID=A0A6J5T3I9_9CAUD|nr:major_cap_HK97, phage major capsid protein, HK97 family [uncultured Caudovirales phage]